MNAATRSAMESVEDMLPSLPEFAYQAEELMKRHVIPAKYHSKAMFIFVAYCLFCWTIGIIYLFFLGVRAFYRQQVKEAEEHRQQRELKRKEKAQ